ncbi:DNA phosphorothioation-dependent restriction protein DptF [Clostridioides difficile]
MINNCLIDELKKLKESSKEAVDNVSNISSFKKYIHVKRFIEDELFNIIVSAAKSNKSELILVCGGVGDGKSHTISYLKNEYPEIISKFKIHNDATESFEPEKTSTDTLNDILKDFTDSNISYSNKKLILAINLGVLSNFIESKYADKFTKLSKYVRDKGILNVDVSDNFYDENSNFQFVNFSDYNIYTLNSDKPKSKYIDGIINKIIKEDNKNRFMNSYKKNCISCVVNYKCPIKINYEMLMKNSVKEALIDILIESTIKNKIIISTRSLMNFLYDFLVNVDLDNKNKHELMKFIERINHKDFIKYIFVSNLFNHSELSQILNAISKIDPVNISSENLDNIIIKLSTTEDMTEVFREYLDLCGDTYLETFMKTRDIIESTLDYEKRYVNKSTLEDSIINMFIRLNLFIPKENLQLRDTIYMNYMKNLYDWNKGNKTNLKDLYKDIKKAIYNWDGEAKNGMINISVGQNQVRYKISQRLNIAPDIKGLMINDRDELYKFRSNLKIKYKDNEKEYQDECYVDIDFNLYELLMRVKDGYRPNNNDKYNYINFVIFMDKIQKLGSKSRELYIEDKLESCKYTYQLTYDKDFDEFKFMNTNEV